MKIVIGADIVPTESNQKFFCEGKIDKFVDEKILEFLASADIRIFNLEVPLTDTKSPIPKNGPNLIASTCSVKGIKALNPTLLTLANNHILDHDVQGMVSTTNVLRESDIAYVGVGNNIKEVLASYVIEKGGKKIGVYACAEHEFSIAEDNKPGANPFDPLESPDHIRNLKKECDYVVVLYHGGREQYRYPSPRLQKVCRKMCDSGADLVVCQHSHCIGCEEKYHSSTIVYGQGNFIFDKLDNEYWNSGIFVCLEFEKEIEINYLPFCKKNYFIQLASQEEATEILTQFKNRSEEILKADFVQKNYKELAEKLKNQYIGAIYGTSLIFRVLNKLTGYRLKRKISIKKMLILKNFTKCEAHQEIIDVLEI